MAYFMEASLPSSISLTPQTGISMIDGPALRTSLVRHRLRNHHASVFGLDQLGHSLTSAPVVNRVHKMVLLVLLLDLQLRDSVVTIPTSQGWPVSSEYVP